MSIGAGRVVIAGQVGRQRTDFAVSAYRTTTGSLAWSKTINGTADARDTASRVTASPDNGTVYSTGWVDNGTSFEDGLIVALDARAGTPLWSQQCTGDGESVDYADSAAASTDGATVVLTCTLDSSDDDVGMAYGFDATTGDPMWTSSPYEDAWFEAVPSPSDQAIVINKSDPGAVRLDGTTGLEEWSYVSSGAANAQLWGGALSPDAALLFITGNPHHAFATAAIANE